MGRLVIASKGTAWFTNNTARSGGGAISITAALEVTINNTTFTSNTAKFGGAIYVGAKNFHRRVYDNCIFKDNMATEGGAAYFFGGAGVDYVASSVFIDNSAGKSRQVSSLSYSGSHSSIVWCVLEKEDNPFTVSKYVVQHITYLVTIVYAHA